jgi:hypothetical protein
MAKNPPASAVNIAVWSANGGPLSQEAREELEAALERAKLELFNKGHRLLSSTTYVR